MGEDERGRVVGVLPTPQALQDVVDRLEMAGFDRSELGVLAPESVLRDWRSSKALAKDGNIRTVAVPDRESEGAAEGVLMGSGIAVGTLAAGPILAAGGLGLALASVLTGGVVGALAAALVARGFGKLHAEYVQNELERGGLVLWILTRTIDQEDQARQALRDAGASDVQVQVPLKR